MRDKLRHRQHVDVDDSSMQATRRRPEEVQVEHHRHDVYLDPKEHSHHHHHHHHRTASIISSSCYHATRRRIMACGSMPSSNRTSTTITSPREWILRLLILSLLLFVVSTTILIVWAMFFPQDSPNSSMEIFPGATGKSLFRGRMLSPPPPNITVSVVIMNHNRPHLLQQSRLLPTLIEHPNVNEILLLHSNPQTMFEYRSNHRNQTSTRAETVVNINAIQANQEMGLSLRFHYCQQARNEWIIIVDDDQEMSSEAISQLIVEYAGNKNNSTVNNDGQDDKYSPYRIVGRYGRSYHEANTWWSWYHPNNHGYDTRTYTGHVEVVLTKFMMLHRDLCHAFFEYQPLVWKDIVQPQSKPLWNGEDIFMSLVANHLYQKEQIIQQQRQQQEQESKSKYNNPLDGGIFKRYNHYATSSLDVWEAPLVEEYYDPATIPPTNGGNSKTGISGNMNRHILFWNVGWTEYWQAKAHARAHIQYRGLLWFTTRQRLAALLPIVVQQ